MTASMSSRCGRSTELNEAAGDSGGVAPRGAGISQRPGVHDLRRLVGDPARDRREDGAGDVAVCAASRTLHQSCGPGSRPSTSLSPQSPVSVDARDKPGHDACFSLVRSPPSHPGSPASTFAGVNGVLSCLMPSSLSASITPLVMQGGPPIAPGSRRSPWHRADWYGTARNHRASLRSAEYRRRAARSSPDSSRSAAGLPRYRRRPHRAPARCLARRRHGPGRSPASG